MKVVFKAALEEATPGCPTSLLRFDQDNPRLEFGTTKGARDDKSMIKALRQVAALNELVQSILTNGYSDIEPLIVRGPERGPFTVLEGNRRLACIRLLQSPALAAELGITLPKTIPAAIVKTIQAVTVYRVNAAEDARSYIGFKHINGPHRWESFAKAKFVTSWYKTEPKKETAIDNIAQKLGDDNRTIRNMIAGMLVLEQAMATGFSVENRFNKGRFAFSHLYTALARAEYMEFLGLQKGWTAHPGNNPVPKNKLPQLKEVMTWLFGAKDKNKPSLIISQNPDLAVLADVLNHPVALAAVRAGRSLEEAQREMRPVLSVLTDVLIDLTHKLREAVSLASRASSFEPSVKELSLQIGNQVRSLNVLIDAGNVHVGKVKALKGDGSKTSGDKAATRTAKRPQVVASKRAAKNTKKSR